MAKMVQKRISFAGSQSYSDKIKFNSESGDLKASNIQDAIIEVNDKVNNEVTARNEAIETAVNEINESLEKKLKHVFLHNMDCNDLPLDAIGYAYDGGATTNSPSTTMPFIITCFGTNDSYKVQTAISLTTNQTFKRSYNETAWTDWKDDALNSELGEQWTTLFMNDSSGITDCNNLPNFTVAYCYASCANTPFNISSMIMTYGMFGYVNQIAIRGSDGAIKTRHKSSSGFSDWVEYALNSDLPKNTIVTLGSAVTISGNSTGVAYDISSLIGTDKEILQITPFTSMVTGYQNVRASICKSSSGYIVIFANTMSSAITLNLFANVLYK